MTGRQKDIRMFWGFGHGAEFCLVAGVLLAMPSLVSFSTFCGFMIVAASMGVASVCGLFLLGQQQGDGHLSRLRSTIVAVAMIASTCGGVYLHSLTVSPAETVSMATERKAEPPCREFVESAPPHPMKMREWGDLNIEPDGLQSEEGVWH